MAKEGHFKLQASHEKRNGRHFDPDVVEKFLECLPQIAHIRKTLRDDFDKAE